MASSYRSRVVYPNRKQEARKRAFGFAFLVLGVFAFVGLLGFGLYSFAHLEKFRIKNISVEGTRVFSQEEIRAFAERALDGLLFFIIPKNNFMVASSHNIEEALQKEFPRIRNVSVKKIFPDEIKISVEERTEWGVLCAGAKVANVTKETNAATNTPLAADKSDLGRQCGYLDRDGVLFEYPLEIFGALLPVISDDSRAEIREGDAAVNLETISFFETARNKAKQELGTTFIQLEILKELPDDYRLHTSEGWYVLVPRSGDITLWLSPLKVLLEHELQNRAGLEYIDARFGNKMFYKKKSL